MFKIRVERKSFFLSIILCILMEVILGFSDGVVVTGSRFMVCCIFSYCIYRGLQETFIINPYFLFSITPLSLLMYSEKVSPYYLSPLNNQTFIIGIINMIAFVAALNLTKDKSNEFNDNNDSDVEKAVPSTNRAVMHAYILCFLGLLPVLANMFLKINIPFKSIIGFFLFLGIAMAFKSKSKMTIIICILLGMLNFIEDFNKTRLLYLTMTVLVCFEVYYIKDRKTRIKFYCGTIAVAFLMIVVAFPLKSFSRGGGSYLDFFTNFSELSSNAFSYYNTRIQFDGPSVLAMPYMYLVSAWNNVRYVMETQSWHTYGLWMLKPLLGYLQLDGLFANQYILTPASSFNTFTFVTVLYKDFGYIGSIFGSLFLGYFVKKIYLGVKPNCSAFYAGAYGLVAMATLEMFFSNHFFGLSYPFTVVIIGAIYRAVFSLKEY